MEALFHIPPGDRCATNHPLQTRDRGIERDLLPWCEQHKMPVVAHSPLSGGLDSGAKCNKVMQNGFARLCQAL